MPVSFFMASINGIVKEVLKTEAIVDTLALQIGLFGYDDPLVTTIKFDIKAYQRNKRKEEYMQAALIYPDEFFNFTSQPQPDARYCRKQHTCR